MPGAATRERVLEAACETFAERGYRGATLREIASRAGVNLASAHYHFGSKQGLYLEVARHHFEALSRRLADADAGAAPPRSRADLEARFEARLRAMLGILLEAPGHHLRFMQRELCDPSELLPEITRRFTDRLRRDLQQLLAALAPGIDPADLERCVYSVVGQVFFYAEHRPALLLMMRRRRYPPDFVETAAAHVARFSLAGLAALAGERERRREPRRASA